MATSHAKKSKSPIVRIFNDLLVLNSQTADCRNSFLENQATLQEEKQRVNKQELDKEEADLQTGTDMALEASVRKDSVKFYAISYLCKDAQMRKLFMRLVTTAKRVQFLKRFCTDYNLS